MIRNSWIFFCFSLIGVLISCEAPVKFEEPQPVNRSDLKTIPKSLRGFYISTTDSTSLHITKKHVIQKLEFSFTTSLKEADINLDSLQPVAENTYQMLLPDEGAHVDFKVVNDSISGTYLNIDTLFSISEEQKLRKFGGNYFLNYRLAPDNWEVKKVRLQKKVLDVSQVQIPSDIDSLKQLVTVQETVNESDSTVEIKLKPTKKELKRLMEKHFTSVGTYLKVKR